MPSGDDYKRLLDSQFAVWRLKVDGLVERPLALPLNQLKDLPSRTQITQHQCDEGWTAIAAWTGVPVGSLLQMAGLRPEARYVVFRCLDWIERAGSHCYESLDLFDAFHPQTILAYDMNGRDLPVKHGAPLRLRAEFHIGYKNAKFVDRLEVVDSLRGIGKGRGSLAADRGCSGLRACRARSGH
jgi:DMSO/TMAO reductase YedYZ molybdopterin-dependent catalytic subunit